MKHGISQINAGSDSKLIMFYILFYILLHSVAYYMMDKCHIVIMRYLAILKQLYETNQSNYQSMLFQFKFTDLGMKCGMVKDWYKLGLYFPEGAHGIGVHECTEKCEILLCQNTPNNLSINDYLDFEWKKVKYSFGLKIYAALEGMSIVFVCIFQ